MDGEPGGEAATPDESPWQRGSDAVFERSDTRPFASFGAPSGAGSSRAAESGSMDRPVGRSDVHDTPLRSERPANTGGDPAQESNGGRGLVVGAIAAIALLLVASIAWTQRESDGDALSAESGVEFGEAGPDISGDSGDVFLLDDRTGAARTSNEVGSNVAPGTRSGDVAVDAGELPLLTTQRLVCLTPRLPSSLNLAWTAGLPGVRRVQTPVTVGDRTIVAVVGIDSPDAELEQPVALTAVDAATGAIRWTTGLGFGSEAHEIIGVTDGVVVVEQVLDVDGIHQLVGFGESSGVELWRAVFESTWAVTIDAEFGLIVVDVEPKNSVDVVGATKVINARTGQPIVELSGRYVSVEAVPAGFAERGAGAVDVNPAEAEPVALVVSRAGDKVLGAVVDTTGLTPSRTGDAELLGATIPSARPYAIVDGRFVSTFGDPGSTMSWSPFGSGAVATKIPWSVSVDEIEQPGTVGALTALGGRSVAVSGAGSVVGVRVFQSIYAEPRWEVRGLVSASVLSDVGRLLLISSDGGSVNQVVNGSTGERIVELPLAAGATTTFAMYPNGVLFLDRGETGMERVAVDLDGTVLWTLPGNGPLSIGDRTVVQVEARSDPGGVGSEPIRLLAYGDDVVQPESCKLATSD